MLRAESANLPASTRRIGRLGGPIHGGPSAKSRTFVRRRARRGRRRLRAGIPVASRVGRPLRPVERARGEKGGNVRTLGTGPGRSRLVHADNRPVIDIAALSRRTNVRTAGRENVFISTTSVGCWPALDRLRPSEMLLRAVAAACGSRKSASAAPATAWHCCLEFYSVGDAPAARVQARAR